MFYLHLHCSAVAERWITAADVTEGEDGFSQDASDPLTRPRGRGCKRGRSGAEGVCLAQMIGPGGVGGVFLFFFGTFHRLIHVAAVLWMARGGAFALCSSFSGGRASAGQLGEDGAGGRSLFCSLSGKKDFRQKKFLLIFNTSNTPL